MILSCTTLTSNGAAVAGTASGAIAEPANGNSVPQPLRTSTPTHLQSERPTPVRSPEDTSSLYRQQSASTVSKGAAATFLISYSHNGNVAIGHKQQQRPQKQEQLQENHQNHYMASHRIRPGNASGSNCCLNEKSKDCHSAGEKARNSVSLMPGNYYIGFQISIVHKHVVADETFFLAQRQPDVVAYCGKC